MKSFHILIVENLLFLHSTFSFFLAVGNLSIATFVYYTAPKPVAAIDSSEPKLKDLPLDDS